MGYTDNRTDEEKELDDKANVTYLTGDIHKKETWKRLMDTIGEKTDGGHVDLFLERGYGPVRALGDKSIYRRRLDTMWTALNPDRGAMILQVPDKDRLESKNVPVKQWVTHLADSGVEHLYVPRYDSFRLDANNDFGLLAVVKTPDHLELPTVTSTDIREGYEQGQVFRKRQKEYYEALERARLAQQSMFEEAQRYDSHPWRMFKGFVGGIIDDIRDEFDYRFR